MSIKEWFRCNFQTGFGLICLQFKLNSKAADAFRRSILITPTASAYCGLGISFLQRNNYEAAVHSLSLARMLDPKNEYNQQWLSWALHLHCHAAPEPSCRHCKQHSHEKPPSSPGLCLLPKKQHVTGLVAKVLVVLQYPESLRIVSETLESIGHSVFKASNFLDAIDILKKSQVDLLIADVSLQDGGNIFDFLRWVMGDPSMNQVPFVCFSTETTELPKYQYDGVRAAARALGAAKYLTMEKFNSTAFSKEIESLLTESDHASLRQATKSPSREYKA